jgi:hypothetical protein
VPARWLGRKVEITPEHLHGAAGVEVLENLERVRQIIEVARPLARCSSARSLVASISSRKKVGIAA